MKPRQQVRGFSLREALLTLAAVALLLGMLLTTFELIDALNAALVMSNR